jgi:hypothetical protein
VERREDLKASSHLGYGAFLGFLPLYAKTVGLNDAEIAIVLGSQLATAVVAKPIGGRLSQPDSALSGGYVSFRVC